MTTVSQIGIAPQPTRPNTFMLTANDGSPGETVAIGTVFTTNNLGRGIPAYAHVDILAQPVGFAAQPVTEGRPFQCQYAGPLVLTLDQWAEVVTNADNTHELHPGSTYYVSPDAPGQITDDPGATSGDFAVIVGRAIDATTLFIKLGDPVEIA